MLNENIIVDKTKEFVRKTLQGESSGHDWFHAERVLKNAVAIAKCENGNLFVIQLAALLHDISDWKFNNGDETVGADVARSWLRQCGVPDEIFDHVTSIIQTMSFKGAGVRTEMQTLEGKIVQDADRLDAIGAIGIARTLAYGGHDNREIYNPEIKPVMHQTAEQYKKNASPTINHFYEKLLLLKDLMNTATAKKIAENRHQYMLDFLERFYQEWDGII